MCLSVPGRVLSVTDEGTLARRGQVDFEGEAREANLSLVPEAGVGDWVLVHTGVAIRRVEATEAAWVIEQLGRLA